MSSQPYPLLIQGLFTNANAGQQTIEPAGAGSFGWQNKITTGRGKLVLLDFITTNIDPVSPGMVSLGRFNYIVGGQTVVQNMEMRSFIPSAFPRSNEILKLKQPGGQSVSLNFINTADAAGLVVHHYFENQFATAEVIEARNTSELKQRIQEITNAFQTGIKGGTSQEFTVPTGIGNVVAVEFILNTNVVAPKDWTTSAFSVEVNGISILDNVAGAIFLPCSARPGLIFPIVIKSGSTIKMSCDTSAIAAGDTMNFTMRLYFDNDVSGNKIYTPSQC